MSLIISVPLHGLEILDLQGCSSLSALPDHLSGSVGLRELRLQQSGVMLSGEDTRELETSCKSLKVFLSSAKSMYGNEYVTIADRSRDESGTTEFDMQNGWRSRSLPDSLPTNKITRIIYSNAGGFIMALTSDGMHKRWDWENEATVSVAPHLWKPAEGVRMINVNTGMVNPEEVVPCMALAWNDFKMVSASGGEVSVYTIEDTELHFRSIQTPSAATSLAFHPKFQEVVVVGMEDSTIQIYDATHALGHYQFHAVCTLTGHQKRITGLGFSLRFNVLVSVGADAQLCVWKLEEWSKRHSRFGPLQPDRRTPCMGDIRVQFRNGRRDLMVVGKSQLAVYDFQNLGAPFLKWVPQSPFGAALSDATYSCDGKLVYASFVDGSIAILSAHYLKPMQRLAFPIYPPRGVSGSTVSYPMAIAAHPNRPCQFAVGLSDGSVTVLEFSRAPAGEESESGVATTSAAVVQDRPIADEKDEEPRIPDTDVARCGCLDYCSCVFFTSAVGDCSGSSSGVTGTDTSKDESGGVEINMQKKYQSRRLPDTLPLHEVISLIYSDAGDSLVAITSNGLHKRWDWENEAAVSFAPHLWCPDNGALVTKDINYNRPGEVVTCMALFRDSCHMIAASGGEVVVFHILNTKVLCTLEGHQKRIISLVFSTAFNVLVSLGADAQMCLWKVEEWSKQQLNSGPLQPDRRTPCVGDLRVQFRYDKRGLLAVAKSQLAVYDVSKWDRPVAQWILPSSSTSSITDANFSCDGRSVYAAFSDGYVDVFSAYDLRRVGGIRPPIRTPQGESGSILYPLAIAAHPKKPGQIALGMSDGTVLVVEPWKAPEDNEPGSGPTVISQEHRRIDQIEEEGEDGDVQLAHCGCLDHFLTFFSTR
ncbi:hypothetical protein M758_10G139900 [Ceratodon purpureus]|nr:hypothetical protein M758_10G139900 [Ceratodon purpureus]